MFQLIYGPALALLTLVKYGKYGLFRQLSLAMLCLLSVSAAEAIGNAANGKALYDTAPTSCASAACHGANPLNDMNKISRGANNGTVIMNAIRLNKGGMRLLLNYVSAAQADDIGAYIADPGAAIAASQTIGTISFQPTALAVGGTTTASATATSGLAVSFTSKTPGVCTVSGNTVTAIATGTCTIAADQAGNAGYIAAVQVTQNIPVVIDTVASPLTGLWWNQNESGWGMSLTQRGSMVFVALYTYDQTGQPVWLVMSSCPLAGSSCTGDIYDVKGGTPLGVTWNGTGLAVTKVGTGTLTFTDNNAGTFDYTVNGVNGTRNVTRQMFATGAAQPAVDYSALWWNESESGWGVAITQQYETIFVTMYTYGSSGNPVWYVASNCAMLANGCSGDLYQVSGGSMPTATWNGANLAVAKVGTVNFVFNSSSVGTMSYTINGVSGVKAISRQLF